MGKDVFITMSGTGWFTGPFCALRLLTNIDWNDTGKSDSGEQRSESGDQAIGMHLPAGRQGISETRISEKKVLA